MGSSGGYPEWYGSPRSVVTNLDLLRFLSLPSPHALSGDANTTKGSA